MVQKLRGELLFWFRSCSCCFDSEVAVVVFVQKLQGVARRVVLSAQIPTSRMSSVDIRLCAKLLGCIDFYTHKYLLTALYELC